MRLKEQDMLQMVDTIHLSKAELRIVTDILAKHFNDCDIWAFGSRVTGKYLKLFSDLDLVIKGANPLPLDRMFALKYDFIESDLPFKVDVSDWYRLDETMKKNIIKDRVILMNSSIK